MKKLCIFLNLGHSGRTGVEEGRGGGVLGANVVVETCRIPREFTEED